MFFGWMAGNKPTKPTKPTEAVAEVFRHTKPTHPTGWAADTAYDPATTDITEMAPREARKHVEALFKKIASLRADGDTDALEKLLNSIPHTELLDMAAMIHEWADT